MANMQRPKGTLDFYYENSNKLEFVENVINGTIKNFGFTKITTPIFESTDVFMRIGEESDVVSKEMYTFKDKGDRSLTLRPEGTSAVVRCFLENKLYANPGVQKFYYIGPMFRYERPQLGRYRQFIQFGVEAFGISDPLLDSDIIYSAYLIFKKLGIKNVHLAINTIGDFESRKNYSNALRSYFNDKIDELCPDCQRRLGKNPMRILDCKVDMGNKVLMDAPKISDYLTDEAKLYFKKVLKALDDLDVPYEIDEGLVRGLDYYTDTVFEFILDSNDGMDKMAICAGGKYSSLVKQMGGPDIPGVGYAFGLERIIEILSKNDLFPVLDKECTAIVIGLDEESKVYSLRLANSLRENNFKVELDYKNISLKQQFKLADRLKSQFILICGEEERRNNQVTIKDKLNNTQEVIDFDRVVEYINKRK